jgi:N-acetylneuraminic acid mutarotase
MLLRSFPCLLGALALAACGGGGDGTPAIPPAPPSAAAPPSVPTPQPAPTPQSFTVEGAVQKGPFLVGSTVMVNSLDDRGRPLTSTLLTEIEDSIGSFSFETENAGPVQIVATGYYFSELTGQPSSGMLSLKALYRVTEHAEQTAHVNILTHLINDRVLELIADGTRALADAIEQAEDELTAEFFDALPVPDLDAFSAMNLYEVGASPADDFGSAYLLALSTAFYKYAENKGREFGTSTDAELTLILNEVSDDLADDGELESGPFMADFVTAIRSLSPGTIAANLRSRSLADYPQGLDVPDISMFLSLCAGNFDCAWAAGAPMPRVSRGHAAAEYDGKIYVFGGVTAQPSPTLTDPTYEYDPAANEWTAKAPMPQGSYVLAAHTLGDHIYVVTGYDSNGFQNGLHRYDPNANTWSARAARPSYRYEFSSAVVDGKIYVIGGEGMSDDGPWRSGGTWTAKDRVEIYDPVADTWTIGAPAPTPIAGGQACVFSNEIFVFGGRTAAGAAEGTSVLTYDTVSDAWSAKSPMTELRGGFACVVVGGDAYLLGGRDAVGQPLDLVQKYDPFVETWTTPTRLPTARYWFAAVPIGERIFTFGGSDTGGAHLADVVEIFDTGFDGP